MATFVKKITVGTPIRAVTSGAFSINNIDGVEISGGALGSGDSGDILVYSASRDAYLNTNTLTDFRVGQLSFKDDSIGSGLNPVVFNQVPELKSPDAIFDSADVTSKAYVDREVEKVKHVIFTTDDNFTDSVHTYADETIRVLGGNGITTKGRKLGSVYNLTIDLDSTNAVDGTYGSATQIPIIKINELGLVDSVGTTAVAGVTSFAYDSSSGLLTVNTADGNSFTDSINLNPFNTGDLTEGSNLYYTRGRFDSALGDSASRQTIRNYFSTSGDLLYNPTTGVISVDVEQVYTSDDFDSDLDAALNSNSNLHWYPDSNYYDLTETGVDSGTYGSTTTIPVFTVDKYGRLDSVTTVNVAGVSSVAFDSTTGVYTINTADGGVFAQPVYSQELTRTAIVEGTGVHYDSVTGIVSIGQPVETTSDVTFGKVTTDSVVAGGPVTVTGQVEVTGNIIPGADSAYDLGSTTRKWRDLHLSGSSLFLGSLVMRDSGGNMTIHGPNKGAVEVTASRGVFDSGYISQLVVDSLQVTNLDLSGASLGQIDIDSAHIDRLDVQTAYAYRLTGDSARIENFSADILNADSVSVGFVKFDQVAYDDNVKPSNVEGAVYYNSGPDALVYKPATASPVKIGQDDVTRVYNNTGAMIPKGTPVYVTGASNDFPTIAKAKADAIGTIAETLGILKDSINNGAFGLVVSRGLVGRIDTSSFAEGSNVFVSADSEGKFVTTAPAFPNFAYKIGTVLVSDSLNGPGVGGCIQVNPFREFFEQIRVTGSGRIDQDFTIGGNLTVIGSQVQTSVQSLAVSDTVIEMGAGDTIGLAATNYAGTGNNDGSLVGHYTGDNVVNYHVRIDSVGQGGEGDKIQWSFNSNYSPLEPFDSANGPTSFVLSSGDKVAGLADGVSISFTAETGHNLNDSWNGEASPINVQIGIVGNYNPPADSHAYSGLIRDPSDNRWKFFQQYLPDPQANINFGHASLEYAPVQLGTLYATTVNADLTGDVTGTVSDISNHSTSNLAEGTNRYFTDARVDSSIQDSIATNNLHVTTGYIGQFIADSTFTTQLNVATGDIDTFTSADAIIDSAYIAQLNVVTGNIDSAIITDISGTSLNYNTIVRSGATDHSGVYGSASKVPILTVDSSGFIDSIGTTDVAGVTGFAWAPLTNQLTISTADGGSFTETINNFDAPVTFDSVSVVNGNLLLLDDIELRVGNAQDLVIKHDGTKSYISNRTGQLIFDNTLNGNKYITIGSGPGFGADSGVSLYYKDSLRLNTLTTGVNVTGRVNADSAMIRGGLTSPQYVANVEAYALGKARISSKVDEGFFDIISKGVYQNTRIIAGGQGHVDLMHDSTTYNLRTTADGINVYGDLNADSATVNIFTVENDAISNSALLADSAVGAYNISRGTISRSYKNTGSGEDSSSDPIINLYVRTDFKTSNHRYFGTGSAKGYYISYDSDGLRTSREMQSPHLDLIAGRTYRFHHHDSSMATHAIRFYYDDAKNGIMNSDSAAFIEYKGTAGDKNVGNTYSQIRIKDNGPRAFAYQCINHPYMGNSVSTNATGGSRIMGSSSGIKVDGTIEGTIDGGVY